MNQTRLHFLLTAVAVMTVLTSCTDIIDNPVTSSDAEPLDEQTAFTIKQVPVNRNGESGGTVAIRFYDDMPSVPYISVADFQNVVLPGTTVKVAMTSLMYNQSFVRAQNLVTGQNTVWYYDVDRNFDGKFDAQDQLVHYDLNFCVLTCFRSFSCGNLFPALCKEAGVLKQPSRQQRKDLLTAQLCCLVRP